MRIKIVNDSKLNNSFYSQLINEAGTYLGQGQTKDPFSKLNTEKEPNKGLFQSALSFVPVAKNLIKPDDVDDNWIEKPKEKIKDLDEYPHRAIWFFISNCQKLEGYKQQFNDLLLKNISSLITNSLPLWNAKIKGYNNVKTLYCQFIRYLVDNNYHNSIITYFMVNAFDQPENYQPNGKEQLFFSNIANNDHFFEHFGYIHNQKKVLEYFFREYHMHSNGEKLERS
ncbi:hypothetical protein ACTFIW_001036, partial [Dictyostelium discoideum]